MFIITTVVQAILIVIFLFSGVGKVYGSLMHIQNFTRLQLPQWFRVVTGITQLIGAMGLIVGYFYSQWATIAGIWLAIIMLGAIFAHIRIKDSFKQTLAAIVLFCLIIVFLLYLLPTSLLL
ncbi:DoxX family protein [Metasolibacillus meyeri]|uniref:DoxX family protein n=1 Tax=Metasolibacillus meyeri TaxID=1071052 RepID=A0AAW9NQ21_9BACL|nr:DoxX family protein [Metasolibacillus meyeri]MEC1179657.1 DoxX family protein [Metasolibacillus meyeri]